MNIALDSNVIIRDSWFRSQRTRALLDYLAATPWHLVITEVVEAEVRAHVRREIEKVLKQVATGLEKAEKLGVSDLPTVDVQTTLERTMEQWEQHWHQFLDSASADRITIGAEEAAEAVRRAAERVAPCSAKGEGIRDALIWLTLVRVARGNGEDSKLAFISENTKDFAAPDEQSLREELAEDLRRFGSDIVYYASLDDFLREHAEPAGYITEEWVQSKVNWQEIEDVVRGYVLAGGDYGAFKVSDPATRELYAPWGEPNITSVALELKDYYVWQFDDGHVEVRMIIDARIEAAIDCVRAEWASPRLRDAPYYPFAYFVEEQEDAGVQFRTLDCLIQLEFDMSARVEEDSLANLGFEGVRRT